MISQDPPEINPTLLPMALTYNITTLGCRVNHAETRELEAILIERGLRRAEANGAADIEVVHTCSVTNAAARKSRHAARRARRASGSGIVLVTGCYAGTNPRESARLFGRENAIPQQSADGLPLLERFSARLDALLQGEKRARHAIEAVRRTTESSSPNRPAARVASLPILSPPRQRARHIRAEVKIQDGCDAHCTFCVIPRIRRTLRSKSIGDAVEEAKRLVDLGHREIVLTGIFIGAYGHETALRRRQEAPGQEHLADLLDAVAQVSGLERLRISSMEPGDLTPALLDAMVANAPTVVPHLHLPLQSGSDEILRRMNRQYRVGDYLEMIGMANEALTTPDGLAPAITTDIICGFPGETDEDFERTIGVARQVGYLHMHVFPFSPREGTAAARWRDCFIPDEVRKERVRRLIELEEDAERGLSIRYRSQLLGRTLRVILERPSGNDVNPGRADGSDRIMTGRCDHYALVHIATDGPRGTLVHARITQVTPSRTIGEVVDAPLSLTVLQ